MSRLQTQTQDLWILRSPRTGGRHSTHLATLTGDLSIKESHGKGGIAMLFALGSPYRLMVRMLAPEGEEVHIPLCVRIPLCAESQIDNNSTLV